ncbi:acyltransferase family protein [Alteromonas sp. 5E99-2]|uniref:acyltransferase family protein n=1 Tax=Alteromonas sp. 5E99-2 TaxID=2817683 RepID=UPI001A98C82E|nr:acyltransferase family protein [Alteromonas sp. 5E99-2]MBO1255861.1 acyltransferase family protein [Alteromonas sp. 5E99-2]
MKPVLDFVNQAELPPRLFFLDWLRVAAIAVLVLYHTAMVYVPEWGFHYKVPIEADWLKSVTLLTSPWRMGLLWLISGVAFSYMCLSKSLILLAQKRSNQLLLPLLIGIFFVVPIQLFVQMKQGGDMPLNFLGFVHAFYFEPKNYFDSYSSGIWPRFDVNHLWFIRSLWRFSMLALIFYPLIRLGKLTFFIKGVSSNLFYLVLVFAVPIMLIQVYVEGEAVREWYGFTLFLLGFLLGNQNQFYDTLAKHKLMLSGIAIFVMLGLQLGFIFIWQANLHEQSPSLNVLIESIYTANKLFPLLMIMALAYHYLNKPNSAIKRLNDYVYPLYIVHQTVIVALAYIIATNQLMVSTEPENQFLLNLLLSPLVCLILVIIISKFNLLRVLFGMRLPVSDSVYSSKKMRGIIFVICIPIIWQLVV